MEKLKARMISVHDEVDAILKKAETEERDLSDEEREKVNAGIEEMKAGKETIERAEEMRDISSWMEETADPVVAPEIPGVEKKAKPFNSLGEQLRAVINAGMPGGQSDKRLLEMRQTGLNEQFPGEGGFLVQQDFSNALWQNTFKTSVLMPRCRNIPLSAGANSIRLPMVNESSRATTRFGGILAYWIEEAGLKVASQPKFRQIELNLHKLVGVVYLTDELMQDVSALEAWVSAAFAEEFGFQIDDAIIRGTGAGQPLGILPSGCLVTVAAEVGQAVDTIVFENVAKMRSRMPYGSRGNAVWLINQAAEPQLQRMSLAVGTGGVPVYMPQSGVSTAPYDTLYGAPVIPIEHCSALGDVGDIIYGDFSQYLTITKGGMQSASSIHVNFMYDETILRFVLRIDGQPIPATPLTPYLGGAGATTSPFVTLAAR